jgi:hypothetical protein
LTVANEALQASQEAGSALTRDLQYVRASADVLQDELFAKLATLDELVIQEREVQTKL